MFLVAFQQLGEAYSYYFSHTVLYLISIPIAVVRTLLSLYKSQFRAIVHGAIEVIVELVRLIQYTAIVMIGTGTSVSDLLSSISAWGQMFAGIHLVHKSEVIWEVTGFVIVLSIYKLFLFIIVRTTITFALHDTLNGTRFDGPTLQNAILLAFKNLFLIPVAVIYLFLILRFIT
ncbi:MAG: hypothetical protein K0Q81_237 [Paenibacillus sp.]|nr:hypothetical protein [Paenibacillus sp.]